MIEELHVIIVWEKARFKEVDIDEYLRSRFVVLKKVYYSWDSSAILNMSRFYALKQRYVKAKIKDCGEGEFIVYIVRDY